jgi:hypothetical protein
MKVFSLDDPFNTSSKDQAALKQEQRLEKALRLPIGARNPHAHLGLTA